MTFPATEFVPWLPSWILAGCPIFYLNVPKIVQQVIQYMWGAWKMWCQIGRCCVWMELLCCMWICNTPSSNLDHEVDASAWLSSEKWCYCVMPARNCAQLVV